MPAKIGIAALLTVADLDHDGVDEDRRVHLSPAAGNTTGSISLRTGR
jgi:hypothetical protein